MYKPPRRNSFYYSGYSYYISEEYRRSYKYFNKSSAQGDELSTYYIGILYENGLGLKKNYHNAFECYLQAADSGDALAQKKVGRMYQQGIGTVQNYSKAFTYYLKSAQQDQLAAQIEVAQMYENGIGTSQDYLKAYEWYQIAADYDDAYAQYRVGTMYEGGLAVAQDYLKSFEWYLNAALQGYLHAQYKVGTLYERGLGVDQNYLKAFEWYLHPANKDNEFAQCNIGHLYESGHGLHQDYKKAFRWYVKAAKQNNASALHSIGYLYKNGFGIEQNHCKALEFYLESVSYGTTNLCVEIGNMYANGLGTEQDYQEAHKWYLKAVNNDDPQAYIAIGNMYAEGSGVTKSYSTAYKLYLQATELDSAEACITIANMYADGLGVIQSSEWADKWYQKSIEQDTQTSPRNAKNMTNFISKLKAKLAAYKDTSKAQDWLSKNISRVEKLFSDVKIRDFVFEPIKDVFALSGKDEASEVHAAITRVAIANAVLAGLPGKMGVGIFISIALEAWMAWVIAKRVGIKITDVGDIWKYMGMFAAVLTTIFWGIKALLGLGFSAFSVIPGINPLILAELFVTNFVGILFYCAWQEARDTGSFKIPYRALKSLWSETKALFDFQADILRNNLSLDNLKMMGQRLKAWLMGDIPSNQEIIRGELFPTLAIGWLLAGQFDRLQGPIGQEFIMAIRDRYPDLESASLSEISEFMSGYDADQMVGVVNLIKGKLFERLVTHTENTDNDAWHAYMHEDESYPGSDIVFTNNDTGEILEISLKATDNSTYIENALLKYPDIPIMSTDEVAQNFDNNPMIMDSGFSNEELQQVTEQNFETMLSRLTTFDAMAAAGTGVSVAALLSLWPFVIAYLNKRIGQGELQQACEKVAGDSGVALASRLSYALLLGPIFAWYLLARGVLGVTKYAEQTKASYRVSYVDRAPIIDGTQWQPA